MFYTYVLKCIDPENDRKIFYIGSTADLKERLVQHKNKNTKTTRYFDKIELIYYEACRSKTDAIIRENQLKTGFGRGYIKKRLQNYFKDSRV